MLFVVHPSFQSHTGAVATIGKGMVYSMLSEQKSNTQSSTEAELVGINDAMSMILWVQHLFKLRVILFATTAFSKTMST